VLVRRSLLQDGSHLGFDGPESLESWRTAKLDFPSPHPPNKRAEDWATEIASGELEFRMAIAAIRRKRSGFRDVSMVPQRSQ
jgi:hypothetical protein